MSACRGSYMAPIRVHPETGAGECPVCGKRFDRNDLAGTARNVPLHSPLWQVPDEVRHMGEVRA